MQAFGAFNNLTHKKGKPLIKRQKNKHAQALGKLGGKAGTGASKVRKVTAEQARKAAMLRWDKYFSNLENLRSK